MKENYNTIQCLRGVSALLVVLYHIIVIMHDRLGMPVPRFTVGMAGVDFFFAISGFIMVVVTRDLWGQKGFAKAFFKRRVIRIVPLYWIATTIKLLQTLIVGGAVTSGWHIFASYFFIPAWDNNHNPYPIFIPGWTLSFEMFFYILFAVILAFKRSPVVPLTFLLAAFALIGAIYAPFEQAVFHVINPQLIEFIFGMWIATHARRSSIPPGAAWIVIIVAGACLAISNGMPAVEAERLRVIVFGIPAALILYAMVSLEEHAIWKSPKFLALGNASYAIYLTHGFTIAIVAGLLSVLPLGKGIDVFAMLLMSVLASCMVGHWVHRYIEVPILIRLKRRFL